MRIRSDGFGRRDGNLFNHLSDRIDVDEFCNEFTTWR